MSKLADCVREENPGFCHKKVLESLHYWEFKRKESKHELLDDRGGEEAIQKGLSYSVSQTDSQNYFPSRGLLCELGLSLSLALLSHCLSPLGILYELLLK